MLSLTMNVHCIEPSSLFFSKASSKKLFSQILKQIKGWRIQHVHSASANVFQWLNITDAERAPADVDSEENVF